MKMTKKIILVAIATAAFALTGCAGLLGKKGTGSTSGFKWNKKMTVDGNKNSLYDGTTPKFAYNRFIKKIKAEESVTNIATEIVIDTEKSTLSTNSPKQGQGKAVVGLAFDFHTSADKSKYDFVLIGIAPDRGDNGSFYVERYHDILTAKAESAAEAIADDVEDLGDSGFTSDADSMGDYDTFREGTDGVLRVTTEQNGSGDWHEFRAGEIVYDTDEKTATISVEIKQTTAGLYEVYLAGRKVAEYPGETTIPTDSTRKDDQKYLGFAKGGVAVYANTPLGSEKGKGTKVVVNYKSDKDKTHGLYEEVDE